MDDKGRLCLTDMWKAAGSVDTMRPNDWLHNSDTMIFMGKVAASLNATADGILKSQRGRNGGTYAHWQVALAYAKWLSPELHMEVNKTYMRYKAADPNLALEVIDKQKDVETLAHHFPTPEKSHYQPEIIYLLGNLSPISLSQLVSISMKPIHLVLTQRFN